MATIENVRLGQQLLTNLANLRSDMRANAAARQDKIAENAAEYARRLDWVDGLSAADLTAACAAVGLDESDVSANKTQMRTANNALIAAPKKTEAQKIAAHDAVLTAVPAHKSLWPE